MRGSGKRHSGWVKTWPAEEPWEPERVARRTVLPIRVRNLTNARLENFKRAAYTKKVRNAVALLMRATREMQVFFDQARETLRQHEGIAMIRLTRFGPQVMDDDGNIAALKAVRDEVAALLWLDDGDRERLKFVYHQAKGDYAVRVDIAIKLVVPIRVTV